MPDRTKETPKSGCLQGLLRMFLKDMTLDGING